MNFPDNTQRLTGIGPTGSGKTVLGLWFLSHRDFHTQPWVVYNFKNDKHIDGIPGYQPIGLSELPVSPGIYVAHPTPEDVKEGRVENQMRHIWERGHIGVFIDEVYMIGQRAEWFRALLTQGRSKNIPMIVLAQRPVCMDNFVLSESEYFFIFPPRRDRDLRTVQEFVPAELGRRLPKHWSYYYDVAENTVTPLRPGPRIEVIHSTFERRLRRRAVAV